MWKVLRNQHQLHKPEVSLVSGQTQNVV